MTIVQNLFLQSKTFVITGKPTDGDPSNPRYNFASLRNSDTNCSLSVDDGNNALIIRTQGKNATTIKWTAFVEWHQ